MWHARRTARTRRQYLGFYVAGEEYAIGILRVTRDPRVRHGHPGPETPPSIRGVINLRGQRRAGGGPGGQARPAREPDHQADLHRDRRGRPGGRADGDGRAGRRREPGDRPAGGDIEPPPAFGTRVRVDYLLGMGRAGKKFVLLLDIDKLLLHGRAHSRDPGRRCFRRRASLRCRRLFFPRPHRDGPRRNRALRGPARGLGRRGGRRSEAGGAPEAGELDQGRDDDLHGLHLSGGADDPRRRQERGSQERIRGAARLHQRHRHLLRPVRRACDPGRGHAVRRRAALACPRTPR